MTQVKFFRKNRGFYCVECDGHTSYGAEGEDIVCAALSSIVQTAVLGIFQVAGINAAFERDDGRGYLKITVPDDISDARRHDANVILDTLYLGVSDLSGGYSDFIELEVL
ncbi:MAG: ribosomal-processing cysteine protease Prp [Clostridiales bacterium]|jgi:uncharacterized protein YsxB (DUF464 family)|nr:ribosomal-processing cysteine protease Prp [Clostridiales bacterium]